MPADGLQEGRVPKAEDEEGQRQESAKEEGNPLEGETDSETDATVGHAGERQAERERPRVVYFIWQVASCAQCRCGVTILVPSLLLCFVIRCGNAKKLFVGLVGFPTLPCRMQ